MRLGKRAVVLLGMLALLAPLFAGSSLIRLVQVLQSEPPIDAVSREVSYRTKDAPVVTDAVSREVSYVNPTDAAKTGDAVSREVSYNLTSGVPGAPSFVDAVSREQSYLLDVTYPHAYYGFAPAAGSLTIAASNETTYFQVVNVVGGALAANGVLNPYEVRSVSVSSGLQFKVQTTKHVWLYVGNAGSTAFPAKGQATRVGRNFEFVLPALSNNQEFVVMAYEDADVTIKTAQGVPTANFALQRDRYWRTTGAPLSAGVLYKLESTGTVALHLVAHNGNMAVPSDNGEDVGRKFLFATHDWGGGAIAVFAYEDATFTITDLDTGQALEQDRALANNTHYFRSSVGRKRWKLESTGKVGVWSGDLEGGTGIEWMGDDVAVYQGDRGRTIHLHSQTYGGRAFAIYGETALTVDELNNDGEVIGSSAYNLEADGVVSLAPGKKLRLTANKPVVAFSAGGNTLNDWGVALISAYDAHNPAPDTRIETGPVDRSLVCSQPISFSWSGTDDVTPSEDLTFSYRSRRGSDAGVWSDWSDDLDVELSGLQDGLYRFEVRARDADGNIDPTPAVREFELNDDQTAPGLSAITAEPNYTSAVIRWTTNEPATSCVDYGLTDAYGSSICDAILKTQHQIVIQGLGLDTLYHFRVRSADRCGNSGASVDLMFRTLADTTPPETTITSGPGAQACSLPVSFVWVGADNFWPSSALEYQWRIDGGNWSAWSSATSRAFAQLDEGSHTFEVVARDPFGNIDPTPASRTFVVDTVSPVIGNLLSTNVTPVSATITWTTNEAATSQVEYRRVIDQSWLRSALNGTRVTEHSVTITDLAPNTEYAFRAISRDACGHEGMSQEGRFTTRQAPDLVPLNLNSPAEVTPDVPFNVSWHIQNQGAARAAQPWIDRIYLSQNQTWDQNDLFIGELGSPGGLDPNQTLPRNAAATITGRPTPGAYYLLLVADASQTVPESNENNNVIARATVVLGVNDPPETSIVSGPGEGSTVCQASVAFTVTGQDDHTPVGQLQYAYQIDLQPWSDYSAATTINLTGLSDGAHTFRVRARDTGGKVDASPATRSFTVAALPPVITQLRHQVAQVQAAIQWTTNIPSTSQVEYGETPGLGSSTTVSQTLTQSHLVMLAGLRPNATYYYRAKSKNGCNVEALSDVGTFRTGFAPDLLIEPLDLPTEMGTGQSYILRWKTRNIGQGDAVGNWSDCVYLSTDDQVGNDIRWICADQLRHLRASGDEYQRVIENALPGIAPGTYYLILRTDADDRLSESNEGNNFAVFGPVVVTQTIPPVIAEIGDETVAEGVAYVGPTPSLTQGTLPVTWSLVSGPSDMTIDSLGRVHWQQAIGAADPITVTIKASNAAGSDEESWRLLVPVTYAATVSTDVNVAPAGTPVPLVGEARFLGNNAPAPNVPVEIRLTVRGFKRTIKTRTNSQGVFMEVFEPLPREAGRYTVGASHPSDPEDYDQDQFTIVGAYTKPDSLALDMVPLIPAISQLELINPGEAPLNGLTWTLENAPPQIGAQVQMPSTLPGLATVPIQVSVICNEPIELHGTANIVIRSQEGAEWRLPVRIDVRPPRPVLTARPGTATAGMLVGRQTLVDVQISNDGGAATDTVRILLPNVPWMRLATPEVIGPLAPGDSATVSLLLEPPADLPLGEYTGGFVVGAGRSYGITVDYRLNAITDAKGDLAVFVEDESTYYDDQGNPRTDGPLLANSIVQLLDPITQAVLHETVAGPDEPVEFADITAGNYVVNVRAASHAPYRQNIRIDAGRENAHVAFTPRETIRYNWVVTPTQIPDVNIITLEAVFETNVPAPVVTVDPPVVDLADFDGDSMQINFTIENHGLITAEGVEFALPTHPRWRFTMLSEQIGTLRARERRIVPVRIERVQLGPMSDGPCSVTTWVKYCYECNGLRCINVPVTFLNTKAGCHGIPGGGGGWSGCSNCGGPGGPYHIVPSTRPPDPCERCDPNQPPGRERCIDVSRFADGAAEAIAEFIETLTAQQADVEVELPTVEACYQEVCCPDGTKKTRLTASVGGAIELSVNLAGKHFELEVGREFNVPGLGTVEADLEFEFDIGVSPKIEGDIQIGLDWGCNGLCLTGEATIRGEVGIGLNNLVMGGEVEVNGVEYRANLRVEANAELAGSINVSYDQCRDDPWQFAACFEGVYLNLQGELTFEVNNISYNIDLGCKRVALICPIGNCDHVECDYINCDGFQPLLNVTPPDMSQLRNLLLESTARDLYDYKMIPVESHAAHLLGQEPRVQEEEGVCARVRLQIEQQLTMQRQAFDAALEIVNPSTTSDVSRILTAITFFDAEGNPADDKFAIYPPTLRNVTAVDGTGLLPPTTIANINWIIVPRETAAPMQATRYYVGGLLQFEFEGATHVVRLEPMPIDVLPDPRLVLDYFMQSRVYSDDPFTPEVERAEPFSLGLILKNIGFGAARDVQIQSSQPRIVENERGLLIDFQIVGSQVNDRPITPSLNVNLGDVPPGMTSVARWLMISSLQGRFVEFNADYRHVNPLGDQSLSLIETPIGTHFLDHVVRIQHPDDDNRPDFLVNDDPINDEEELPDGVYSSDGSFANVTAIANGTIDAPITDVRLSTIGRIPTTPQGFAYIRWPDPAQGRFRLVGVTRLDGRPIFMGDNAWTTHRIRRPAGGAPVEENRLHVFDHNPTAFYVLTYERRIPENITPGEAKLQPDGQRVIAGAELGAAVTAVFEDGYYIEALDRSSGIKVKGGIVLEGDRVKVEGFMATDSNDERFIDARGPAARIVKVGEGPLDPLMISVRSLYAGDYFYHAGTGVGQRGMAGGVGLNPVGLLLKVQGRVTDSTNDWVLIDDGDGREAKIYLAEDSVAPPVGQFISAIGVLSAEKINGQLYPALRIRRADDLREVSATQILAAPEALLRTGFNLLSMPGMAANPNPLNVLSEFAGAGLTDRLRRFDAAGQREIVYNSANPADFGNLLWPDGFQLRLNAGERLYYEYQGVRTESGDLWVSLPKTGVTLIGSGFDAEVDWSSTKVTDGAKTVTLLSASRIEVPVWLNSIAYYFDAATQTDKRLGIDLDNPDSTRMQPWYGYWVSTSRDNLALFITSGGPLAMDDRVSTSVNTAVNISVLANDRNPNNENITIVSFDQGRHGAVTLVDGATLRYDPETGFRGIDRFSYTIMGPSGVRSTAVVTVVVGLVRLTGRVHLQNFAGAVNALPVILEINDQTYEIRLTGSGQLGTFTADLPPAGRHLVRVKPRGYLRESQFVTTAGQDLEIEFRGLLIGDANGDDQIDDSDLAIVLTQFGDSGFGRLGDVNGDQVVDDRDLAAVITNLGAR